MGIKCEVLVKCEYLNPGGSMKDRTALKMIEMSYPPFLDALDQKITIPLGHTQQLCTHNLFP